MWKTLGGGDFLTFGTGMFMCLFGVGEIIWGSTISRSHLCLCGVFWNLVQERLCGLIFLYTVSISPKTYFQFENFWRTADHLGLLLKLVQFIWGLRKLFDMSTHVPKVKKIKGKNSTLKPGLHIVRRIVSTCLRPCPKEHITAPQVSIAKISCKRLLLSKTCVTMWKNCLLIAPIILTKSLVHG